VFRAGECAVVDWQSEWFVPNEQETSQAGAQDAINSNKKHRQAATAVRARMGDASAFLRHFQRRQAAVGTK